MEYVCWAVPTFTWKIKTFNGTVFGPHTVQKFYPNVHDITWNVEENEIHEIFRVVSSYNISCYIAENPLGQCREESEKSSQYHRFSS